MMFSLKSLIGAGLGWTLFGPIGAIIGGILGAQIDRSELEAVDRSLPGQRQTTTREDFYTSLMIIFSHVITSDQQVEKREIQYVKNYLLGAVSDKKFVQELMYLLKQLLEKTIDITPVTQQIAGYMDFSSRIQLVHLLFGLAMADGTLATGEEDALRRITVQLGLSVNDFESIVASYRPKTDHAAYKILEVRPDASIDEIKEAYKHQALLYHPDKVAHLGTDMVRQAEAKFKNINEAYQAIRKGRGF